MQVIAQEKSDSLKYKDLKIWSYLKEYEYEAIYIDINGDTITKEIIIIKPTAKTNPLQKIQTLLEYTYNYSTEDSIKLYSNTINANKYTRKHNTIIWRKKIEEGAIESETCLWIHPFRLNQYVLTEIAPFPSITLPPKSGQKSTGITFIQKGWGTFKGRCKQKLIVGSPQTRIYCFAKLDSCYEVNGTSVHSKLGENRITFFYHKNFGFTEMYYNFYNGQRMDFVLKRVININ